MEKEERGKSELSPELLERLSNELKKKAKEKMSSEELSSELMEELSSAIANDATRRMCLVWEETMIPYHCKGKEYRCTTFYKCKSFATHSCSGIFRCDGTYICGIIAR